MKALKARIDTNHLPAEVCQLAGEALLISRGDFEVGILLRRDSIDNQEFP